MPPKKKRGVQNQVTFAVTNMSTRSRKKGVQNMDKSDPLNDSTVVSTNSTKNAPRKVKVGNKPRAKKTAINKKKVEVKTHDTEAESLEAVLAGEENADTEEVNLAPENEMEVNEVESVDTEACAISEQLNNLNVASDDPSLNTEEESIVPESTAEPNPEEQVIEFEDYAVEYITEEFVPLVENTEVIIEEEVVSLDKTEEVESVIPASEDSVNLDLLEPAEEIKNEAVDPVKENQVEEKPLVQVENDEAVKEVDEVAQEITEPVKEEQVDQDKVEVQTMAMEEPEDSKPPEKPKAKKRVSKKEPKKAQPRKKATKPKPNKKGANIDKTEEVRRSSRIKSISVQKQRAKGHGLVKTTKNPDPDPPEPALISAPDIEKPVDSPSLTPTNEDNKPVKVKSRWRRSCEMEMNVLTPAAVVMETCGDSQKISEATDNLIEKQRAKDEEVVTRLKQFVHLKENLYLTDRMTCKEAKKMTCDCFLTTEETERGELGCGEDCLNRLLMIECGNLCPVGDRCTNKKFQKTQFAPVEVFKTEKKGLGLRAAANIPYGEFILEYVGEVLDPDEFNIRADDYSKDKNQHYYFMSLRADAIIDATLKGNISRFINHSCDPNAETQKWTVNGELRIGFFSTRTILAGEEITFDYRFQRYGKEAQKCYCEAAICRGWLGEEPDDEDEEDEEDEEEEAESEEPAKVKQQIDDVKSESESPEFVRPAEEIVKPPKKEPKKRAPRKKPLKDLFEDLDQLDEEIEMLVTTGLKNQAHTLKLSRLMVRAKEPAQRAKLLRVLRRGELSCRRLFLDYHGLRLMHGYMTDAQHLAKTDKKFESLRLEMLQTLATLPIPNKTMLQDSKVLPTVEVWSTKKGDDLPMDSDSSSPQMDQDPSQTPTEEERKNEVAVEVNPENKIDNEVEVPAAAESQEPVHENSEVSAVENKNMIEEVPVVLPEEVNQSPVTVEVKKEEVQKQDEPNYEEEITALALKLLEEWSSLKEVFKIPKKERIEQMKEHEREANRGYIAGLGLDQDGEKKSESRYRVLKRFRTIEKSENSNRKTLKLEDRNLVFPKMGKFERRKMFALQVEQREEERRRKQREMWRQHEQHCYLLGTDPRLTAPFDPNRGYQCIWNPQIGQWQNYPIQNPSLIFNPQNPALSGMSLQAANPSYPYMPPPGLIPGGVSQMHPLPSLPYQEEVKKDEDLSQVKFMGPIPPPVKLPPKWKTAKDKYGRPYYYHIKIRKSQWEPPPFSKPIEEPEDSSETTSSSDTSSLSSDTSSEESDSDDDVDDTRLLMEVRRQMEKQTKSSPKPTPVPVKSDESVTPSPAEEIEEEKEEQLEENVQKSDDEIDENEAGTSAEPNLNDNPMEEKVEPSCKKRRVGLVQEIIISPRTEEDRLQFREDLKRYKQNKEKLKKEKEQILQASKKHTKDKRHKTIIKLKMKEMNDSNSELAKKIKETFRSSMATVVVSVLNAYRKPDCKEGRITNTEDFKHLARKLTHFVMLKEMKHIEKIEDLVCTENVKAKAKEYIRKYMSKFGENYQKRADEPDF